MPLRRPFAAILLAASTLLPCLAHAQEVPVASDAPAVEQSASASLLVPVFFFASPDGLAVAVAPVGGGWLGCVAGTDEDGPKLLGCAVVETAGDQGTSYANPHAATTIGSDTLTYDQNGNLLTKGANNAYAWDYNNRLASSATGVHASAYAYDASGQCVKLVEDGITTLFPAGGYEVTAGVPTKLVDACGVTIAVTLEQTSKV